MTTRPHHYSDTFSALWPWLPLWILVALIAIFSHGPMPLYSTRTLAVAWDMWSHGQWLVPHLNGQPYSEKAPLLFWMIHAGWFVFGVSDIWPRVLEVGFGATELILAMLLARRLFPERPWVARATPWMLLALCYAFLFDLQIMYDVLLAVWALAALLCLTPKPDRAEPRWLLFGVCIGLGLLTKGPVMLLHVVFPWLLGPLWCDWAREHRARWYGRGVLSVLLGLVILAAWVAPAVHVGGEAYRHRLLFTQTAARVVDGVQHAMPLQSHSRPWWWYFSQFPVILFPFFFWPRAWAALVTLRRPLGTGIRFCLCWLLPMLLALSLISGKQAYYPLPEFAGVMLLLAGAIAVLRERHPTLARHAWLGTWLLGLGSIVLAVVLFVMPWLLESDLVHSAWAVAVAANGRYVSVVFLLLGLLLFVRGRGEMRRLAIAGLIGALAFNTLFTLAWWPRYDLHPTAQLLHRAEADNRALAYVGGYDGQFHFDGRLTHPIQELYSPAAIQRFARRHPDGLIVTHPDQPLDQARRYAILIQPFRSSWTVTWPARTLADIQAGRTPAEPRQPTRIIDPMHPGRYRAQP
ncbi:MAG TPA: glycosyltransferase family 39 protein [Rhodanobacteraceae bacterium]|nr:glycosyltransferase family 39 protein [Rhodanobacteraceae bacterium]